MRTLGLIGGMSWESTALYYRSLNELARERLGGLHSARLLLYSLDFAEVSDRQHAGDWDGLADLLADAARRLQAGGADALVLCTNTMHKLAERIEAATPLPLVHVADAAAAAILASGARRPALLATRFTMEDDFYLGRLRRHGIEAMTPEAADRETVHRIIYQELCQGRVEARSKADYLAVIARLRGRGADGVILGCTEIGLLIGASDLDCPVFDTARLHAEAAFDLAVHAGPIPTAP